MEELKKYLNENQDPKVIEKILGKVNELLTTNETVEYIAVQKKPIVTLSPDCVALTNKRVIFCSPKTLGFSMSFVDFQWKNVRDCHIKEGILGSTFKTLSVGGKMASVDYLPKNQARILYRFAQEREEEMSEYRRQRELEEARAGAGGVTVQSPKNETISTPDPLESLQKLKGLFDSNLINQQEYDAKKAEILAKL